MVKDCYAFSIIRFYDSLPDRDTRSKLRKFWDFLWGRSHVNKESFLRLFPKNGSYQSQLIHNIIESKAAWSRDDLGYGDKP